MENIPLSVIWGMLVFVAANVAFIFYMKMKMKDFHKDHNELESSHDKILKDLGNMVRDHDKAMLEISEKYAKNDYVTKMLGLISSPIAKSVEDLRREFKENRTESRQEIKDIHTKIDSLLTLARTG